MGKVTLVVLIWCLIECAGLTQTHANWHTSFVERRKEKATRLHFYYHDNLSGTNPTTVRIAGAPTNNTSPTQFGTLLMADNPLTVGPKPTSGLIGRAQGLYGSASQHDRSFLVIRTLVFTKGKYNGSSINIIGRTAASELVMETPVVGGTGVFRFARGFALTKFFSIDLIAFNAIVEFNVTVLHY